MGNTSFPVQHSAQQVHEANVYDANAPDGATTTVLSDLLTASADDLHVIVSSDVNVTAVLRTYIPGKQVFVDVSLGAVTGGTPLGTKYSGVLGVMSDIRITNASGGAATVTVHATARG
jgi:hypothetical protein